MRFQNSSPKTDATARKAVWLTMLGIAALTSLLVVLHVRSYTIISPIDEFQHVDYLYSVAHMDIVQSGERVGQEAMREEACRGLDYPWELPPCDPAIVYDPADFQEQGYNTAHIHTPLYYVVTAGSAEILETGPVDNLVTAGRLSGAAWLIAGFSLFWLVSTRLGISRIVTSAVVLLLAANPSVLHFASTVNPDATALFAGGLMLYAVFRWEETGRLWMLGVGAAVAVTLKATNIVVVGAVVVYLLMRFLSESSERLPRAASRSPRNALAVTITAAILPVVGWLLIHNAIALGPGPDEGARLGSLPFSLSALVGQTTALLTPLDNPPLPAAVSAPLQPNLAEITGAVIIAACFAPALLRQVRRDTPWVVAATGSISMLLGGVGLALITLVTTGLFFEIPPRYGLSLLPFLGLAVGFLFDNRVGRPTVVGLSALSFLVTLSALLG